MKEKFFVRWDPIQVSQRVQLAMFPFRYGSIVSQGKEEESRKRKTFYFPINNFSFSL
jgi:hypothetical protein